MSRNHFHHQRVCVVFGTIFASVYLGLPPHPAHATACCDVTRTNDGFLALRTGPGSQFPMIKQIPSGEAVCFGSINPSHPNTGDWLYGWHTDQDAKKHYGWVHSQYLEEGCD